MLSKRYESTEVDRRTWLHVPSGTPWSTSSDTYQVVEIDKETYTSHNTVTLLYIACYLENKDLSALVHANAHISPGIRLRKQKYVKTN